MRARILPPRWQAERSSQTRRRRVYAASHVAVKTGTSRLMTFIMITNGQSISVQACKAGVRFVRPKNIQCVGLRIFLRKAADG